MASIFHTLQSRVDYVEIEVSYSSDGVLFSLYDKGLDWMLNGDPISLDTSNLEWQSLMHITDGITSESSCNTTEPLNLNSFALYSFGLDQQNRRRPLFLNPLVLSIENLQSVVLCMKIWYN
ncbi:hypothetical protein E2542_SST05153 [Spatholobus suberectus]|nr:hypothetical protein E2542_SST05153 [Spatholobus suberectus]